MPSVYQLLPPPGTRPLVDPSGRAARRTTCSTPATWERFGWGPLRARRRRDARRPRRKAVPGGRSRARARRSTPGSRARPTTPARYRSHALGGDCLPTLARAVVGEGRAGTPPRFEARSTRASRTCCSRPATGASRARASSPRTWPAPSGRPRRERHPRAHGRLLRQRRPPRALSPTRPSRACCCACCCGPAPLALARPA